MNFKVNKETYISLKEAAKISGYAPDYIGFLIRKGKIVGKKISSGETWMVSRGAILNYASRKKQKNGFQKEILDRLPEFITLKEAARISGYVSDYIGWLVRNGKILGKKIYSEISWQVNEASFKKYQELRENHKRFLKKENRQIFNIVWRFGLTSLVIFFFVFGLAPIKVLQGSLIRAITGEETRILNFYNTNSTGEWQNPENVQGPPDILPDGDINYFSKANSAVYTSGPLGIICENFEQVKEKNSDSEVIKIEELFQPAEPLPTENATTDLNAPVSFLGKVKSFFISKVFAEESTFSAKIKFSFAIGEKNLGAVEQPVTSTEPYEQSTTTSEIKNNSTSSEGPAGFLDRVKKFFEVLALKATQIVKAEGNNETTTSEIINDVTTTTEDNILTATTDVASSSNATSVDAIENNKTETTTEESLPLDTKIRIWWSLDGQNWQFLGTIYQYPLSNALNGGYFEYDAPFLQNFEDVKNLKIEFEGMVGEEDLVTAYLDSAWVEVQYRQPVESELKEEKTEEATINFVNPKNDFKTNEEPEFILPKIKVESFIDKIRMVLWPQNQFEKVTLIGPDNSEVTADIVFNENGENYLIKIKKPVNFQPGKYIFELKIRCLDKIYTAKTKFNWEEKKIEKKTQEKIHIPVPEKRFLFFLENTPLKSKKVLSWYPKELQTEDTGENNEINVSVVDDQEGQNLVFSGRCQKEYYVISMYAKPDDYEKNPSLFIYDKAFPCENGTYQYNLDDLPTYLKAGIYYFFVAEEDATGPWQPITAIQPVRIEVEYK
jgi:hypothetical protein